ncbi:MAG: YraN family protein [Candidatus Moraniibacteriota bacterium]
MKIPSFSIFQDKHDSIGKKGENIAATYLKKKGFKILEMNYINPKGKQLGEIDIIAQKEDILVFVEVKTRRGETNKVFPEDNLTPSKLHKLEKIATHYIQSHHLQDKSYHFDAITVLFDEKQTAVIRHFEHIFV